MKRKGRAPVGIRRRGKPVAKLNATADIYGCMAGTITILVDIVSPLEVEVTADSENVLGERVVFWPEREI